MSRFGAVLVLSLTAILFMPETTAQCEVAQAGKGSCPQPPPDGGGGPGGGQPPVCEYSFPDFNLSGLAESQRYDDVTEHGVSLINGGYVRSETDLAVFDVNGDLPFTRTYRSTVRLADDNVGNLWTVGHQWMHNWGEVLCPPFRNDGAVIAGNG